MAIPRAREEVPPPLPPPRHIEDLRAGQDPGWQWANTNSPIDTGFGGNRLATARPGSSLYGDNSSSQARQPLGSIRVTNGGFTAVHAPQAPQSRKEEERTSFGRQLPHLATSEAAAAEAYVQNQRMARLTPQHGITQPLAAAKPDPKSHPWSDHSSPIDPMLPLPSMLPAQDPKASFVVGQLGRRSYRSYHPPIGRKIPNNAEEDVQHSGAPAKYSFKIRDPDRHSNRVSKKRVQYTISQDSTVETAQHSKAQFIALRQKQGIANGVSKSIISNNAMAVEKVPIRTRFTVLQGERRAEKERLVAKVAAIIQDEQEARRQERRERLQAALRAKLEAEEERLRQEEEERIARDEEARRQSNSTTPKRQRISSLLASSFPRSHSVHVSQEPEKTKKLRP
ncbi:hypothetical protein BKA63DRAFT_4841 [Paraphoma chrysanthemicola]|nr:hypothetical protein BKA63DRAFT_4841 [Paraphoma chrysanthemicola]